MSPSRAIKERFYFIVGAYFRFFANFALRRWHPRIIAITGSVGKTTLLQLVEHELGSEAHYSHNANSVFGISFDLLGLRGVTGNPLRWLYLFLATPVKALYFRHKEPYYVVEMDASCPHSIETIAGWLRPDISFWVSLGRAHALFFDEAVKKGQFATVDEAMIHEFATLPLNTKETVYIDADVPEMAKACQDIKASRPELEIVPCSASALKSYTVEPDHTKFVLGAAGKHLQTTFHFSDPIPRSVALQLTMLQALCDRLEIPLKTDFKGLQLAPGRNSHFKGRGGLQLVDSSYNAHLLSVEAILEMVSEMKGKRKWFVLADMAEQGSIEGEEHTKLASVIERYHPSQVVLVGPRTGKYTIPLLEKTKIPVFHADERPAALDFIEQNAKNGDIIVFKGSNGQGLGWIVENLLADPADAAHLPHRHGADPKRSDA